VHGPKPAPSSEHRNVDPALSEENVNVAEALATVPLGPESMLVFGDEPSTVTLTAAEAGDSSGADCSILRALDTSMTPPANNGRVSEVRIFKSDTNGQALGPVNVYDRSGTTSCPLADGTPATVAYNQVSSSYPEASRCNELQGCKVQQTVDTIGVQISYRYSWITPLSSLLQLSGPGYPLVKSNAMRMEPVL